MSTRRSRANVAWAQVVPGAFLVSLCLACVAQRNPRFLSVHPADALGTWSAATEAAGTAVTDGAGAPLAGEDPARGHAMTFRAPADGQVRIADAAGDPISAVRLHRPVAASAPLVIYHLLVPFFASGDPANDQVLLERPPLYPGGDLQGVLARLEYIRSLGVDAIWLSPVFEAPSDHGYDVQDYYEISGSLAVPGNRVASRELFRRVVRRAHELGLRVILDLPLNHASAGYDRVRGDPRGLRPKATGAREPDEKRFSASGAPFAYWDLDDPDTREFLADVAVHWVRDEGVDGYRFDYARGIPLPFWSELHARLDAIHPGSYLVAEVWPAPWEGLDPIARSYRAEPRAFDSLLDFPICWAITAVFQDVRLLHGPFGSMTIGGDRTPVRLERLLQAEEARYPAEAQPTWFLDNHDLARFTSYGPDPRRLLAAFGFVSALSGHVVLYYGTETGMRGRSRAPMPWNELDQGMLDAFRRMIAVRKAHPSLRDGARLPLHADDRTLVMAKVGATERALVGVNLSEKEITVEVGVGALLDAGAGGATVLGETAPEIRGGKARWRLPPVSTSVWVQPGPAPLPSP